MDVVELFLINFVASREARETNSTTIESSSSAAFNDNNIAKWNSLLDKSLAKDQIKRGSDSFFSLTNRGVLKFLDHTLLMKYNVQLVSNVVNGFSILDPINTSLPI